MIEKRHANEVHISQDEEGHEVSRVETFRLGSWEMWKVQQGLEKLTGDAKDHMAYFAHLLGSCDQVEITITAKWQH